MENPGNQNQYSFSDRGRSVDGRAVWLVVFFRAEKTADRNANVAANSNTAPAANTTAQSAPSPQASATTAPPADTQASATDTTPNRTITIKSPLVRGKARLKGSGCDQLDPREEQIAEGRVSRICRRLDIRQRESRLQLISPRLSAAARERSRFVYRPTIKTLTSLVNDRNYQISEPGESIDACRRARKSRSNLR